MKITTLCLFIGLALSALVMFKSEKREAALPLYSKTIKLERGYGYQIFMNGKLLVHQEFIPAVAGKIQFRSEKDAKKAANRVMQKIQRKIAPDITLQELKELDIVLLGQQ